MDRSSFWTSLRPWQFLHSRLADNGFQRSPEDEIWSLLDELMGDGSYGATSRFTDRGRARFPLLFDDILPWRTEATMRDWIVSRFLEMDGNRTRPIDTRAVLEKCRTEVYKPPGRTRTAAAQENCPVCLENFVKDQVMYRLPCNHLFHKDCLTPWINSNHGDCPCCRTDILHASTSSTRSENTPRVVRPSSITPDSERRSNPTRSANANTNTTSSRTGRTEPDDMMSVFSALEAALNSLGFRNW